VIIPNKKGVEILVKKIFKLLFPLDGKHAGQNVSEPTRSILEFMEIIFSGLTPEKEETIRIFLEQLPEIQETLTKDAEFILKSDPAAKSLEEVIAIYPGFFAIYCYRIANAINKIQVPLLPRMITEYAHKITGIDIHPGATIGSPFSIDHGTGIVIGETSIIGNYVKLYQGVTLGALSVDKSKASTKRHPTIEDNVILYAGSTILGGNTVVGNNSIIGGNVWLTESVVPFSIVYHKSEIVIRDQNLPQDIINFNI
jgi:serine O-acetyltransferase